MEIPVFGSRAGMITFSNFQESDLTSKARLLKGKKLLLVHGTADDNGE